MEHKSHPFEYKNILKNRDIYGNKTDFGKVAIIGGSYGMCGSVDLCAKSALRTGSGLVYNISPRSICDILQIKAVENIILPVADNGEGYLCVDSIDKILSHIENMDAVAIGCGMGRKEGNDIIIAEVLRNFDKPVVIDADGIRAYKNIKKEFIYRDNVVLTPHAAEFAVLADVDIDYVDCNRTRAVERYIDSLGTKNVLVLKGKGSVVFDSHNQCVNPTGNDGMATAGSGDCLTGIVLSLLAQKIIPFKAAKLGVYLHGLAGDLAAEVVGKDSLIASDIIKYLPKAIMQLRNNS